MKFERRFEILWGQQEFDVPRESSDLCVYAQRFAEWTAQVISDVEQRRSVAAVNQAIVLVTRKYFDWRSVVPKSHRNNIGNTGHHCIFSVFEAGIHRLLAIDLGLQPPPLVVPTVAPSLSPAPPAPLQITGIFLGEDDE